MENFMNWKMAGMAGTAIVAIALTGVSASAGANKFTGSISLAVGQSFEDDDIPPLGGIEIFDDSFTSITGEGKVNVAFTPNINLQLGFVGVGSFIEDSNSFINVSLDRDASFQADAHLYYRTDKYALGVFAGGGISSGPDLFVFGSPSAEYYFAGVEGQYYWNNFTFGAKGGYLDSSSDQISLAFLLPPAFGSDNLYLNDAWFADLEARWYVSPKFALTANVGYISGEAGFGFTDVDVLHWGAKASYWPEEKESLELWVAYEGRNTDFEWSRPSVPAFVPDIDKDVHTIKIGVTFHFGVDEGGAMANDRNGPAWNQMDYGAIVVGG
jgi:hypothetical protein